MSNTIWRPTLGLRWRRVAVGQVPGVETPLTKDVLEQRWICDSPPAIEWRPVPVDMSFAETPK